MHKAEDVHHTTRRQRLVAAASASTESVTESVACRRVRACVRGACQCECVCVCQCVWVSVSVCVGGYGPVCARGARVSVCVTDESESLTVSE